METLRGVVERITYHNEETGYTVAKLIPEQRPRHWLGAGEEIAVIGNMASVNVGESVELTGRWTVHAQFGKQFAVEQMRTVLPATVAGIEKYLGSGLIRGVGPVTAKRIVGQFGAQTLDVIEHDAQRLVEVPGVGRKRTQLIMHAWAEQRAIKEVMLFLQSHGVSTGLATKIYKYYGNDAIVVVREDPYRLARDIYGIGFLTADKIARSLGLPADSHKRVAAGVAYALNQAADDGHVFLPARELAEQAAGLLEVTPQQAAVGIVHLWGGDQVKVEQEVGRGEVASVAQPVATDGIPHLVAEQGQIYASATVDQVRMLMEHDNPVYLASLFYSENGVANRLRRLLHEGNSRLAEFHAGDLDWTSAFGEVERGVAIRLAPQQKEAIRAALTHRLAVLTGGPGTGKTTTVDSILRLCDRARKRVLLAAPTGRAAKRLAETTGREAKTLHRLLEFKPSEGMAFKRNEESPLEGDLLIVDEASMLDVVLANHLFKALPPGMHLLLVGDVDQLPSVGAGNVLKDIIAAIDGARVGQAEAAAEAVVQPRQHATRRLANASVIRLETIFRQAEGSYIITNAHRINQGQMPVIDSEGATDFFLFKTEDADRAAQLCVELVQTRIPRRFAIPSHAVQVLSPMHRGAAGVGALNDALQAALNPPLPSKPQRQMGSRAYRAGDRVMQIRNNYDKDVYNGDMGLIESLDLEMHKLTVNFDGRLVAYDFLELDEVVHAFAISVHKSQGSEFPAVVIPILTGHYMMLQRNLLYTAVTRARRLVVLVGQPRAVQIAVRNNRVMDRHTALCERLLA